MSRAANTLIVSDVVTTPIKLKYTSTYDSSSYSAAGIQVLTGINNPISSTGSISQRTLNYTSVRHLFYSNYLTGSYPVSASFSRAYNWEQSTAAQGSGDEDIRIFPTGSGDRITILSIPRDLYGQKISRKSFRLAAIDGSTYNIVDDGNGNLVDKVSNDLYVDLNYYNPNDGVVDAYVTGPSRNIHVGNIIYSQGIIIITNPDYVNLFDSGPVIFDQSYTFYDLDVVKSFSPLTNAEETSSPIDEDTLAIIPIAGQPFPSRTIAGGLVTLNASDPLTTTIGSYVANYRVSSEDGIQSNIATVEVNIIPNCNYQVVLDTYYYSGSPALVFDFSNELAYSNSGSTIQDLSGTGNNGTFTIGTGVGTVTDLATYGFGYSAVDENFTLIPEGITANNASIRLPSSFNYPGTAPYSFVTWVNLIDLGIPGTQPGIISAEGDDGGGNTIGWSWYYDDGNGITAARYDSAGASDTVTLSWQDLGSAFSEPLYGFWFMLSLTYDGSTLTVGGFGTDGVFVNRSVASTRVIPSTSAWRCFVGQRYGSFPMASYGYVAGYTTALTNSNIADIYSITKERYGY